MSDSVRPFREAIEKARRYGQERDEARAEAERLRAALVEIANGSDYDMAGWYIRRARAALEACRCRTSANAQP